MSSGNYGLWLKWQKKLHIFQLCHPEKVQSIRKYDQTLFVNCNGKVWQRPPQIYDRLLVMVSMKVWRVTVLCFWAELMQGWDDMFFITALSLCQHFLTAPDFIRIRGSAELFAPVPVFVCFRVGSDILLFKVVIHCIQLYSLGILLQNGFRHEQVA